MQITESLRRALLVACDMSYRPGQGQLGETLKTFPDSGPNGEEPGRDRSLGCPRA